MADDGHPHEMNGGSVLVPRPVNTGQEQACDARFKPGQSGNPAGRPKGSRNRLADALISELCEDFERHGRSVIEDVRRSDPVAYLAICAKLVPKNIAAEADKPQKHLVEFTTEELLEIVEGTKRVAG